MKRNLYALLLAAVASVSSAGMASAAPAIPDRLYFPNDRGTGWIFIDNNNTQVPRFSKDKIGNVTSFSMHAYSETAGSELFFFIANSQKNDFNGYKYSSDCLYTIAGDDAGSEANKVLAAGKYTAYRYGTLKHCHELPAGEYAIDLEFDSSRSDDGISMEIFDCDATPDNLYFTADMGDGWHYADAPAFTKSGKVFTYTVEADRQFYFFINRKRRSSWDAMTEANSSTAYGVNGDKLLGGNRTIDGTEFDMSLYGTMTRCFTITSPGEYTFRMDFTSGRPHLTITKNGGSGDDPILMDTAMPAKYTGVMLQGFFWDSYDDTAWKNLERLAYDYSNYFDLVWVPNSGRASAERSMGYDPVYWYTNHNSAFGTEDELLTMNGLYNDLNTNMIEDVVVNHRGGATNWTDFPEEIDHNGTTWTWDPSHICSTDEVKNQPDQPKPTGNPDTGDDFDAYRDLDHTNAYVQAGIKAYLNTLHEKYGYNGWRFDMVKGFGAKYVGDYVRSAGMKYAVGEYWDGSFDNVVNWITGTGLASAAFDFPFKFALNKAMNGGENMKEASWTYEGKAQPAGLVHHEVYKRYGVTFVDNHDTYRENDRFKNENLVVAANALMLCSPGTPCVFLRHYLDHMDAINRLIDIRKAVGIHNQSEVEMIKLESNCYVARVKGLYGSLVVKVGSDMTYNCTDAGYTMVAAGNENDNNYCVWANVPIYDHVTMTPNFAPGDYNISSPFKLKFEYTDVPEGAYLVYTTDGSYPTPNNGTQVKLAANRQAKAPARVNFTNSTSSDELNLWIDKPENHVMAAVFTKDHRPYSPLFDGTYTLPGDMTGINGIDAECDGLNVAYNASTRTLEGFDASRARVEVFSTMGTLVATTPSLTELPAGIYIYRVMLDGNTATGRLRL